MDYEKEGSSAVVAAELQHRLLQRGGGARGWDQCRMTCIFMLFQSVPVTLSLVEIVLVCFWTRQASSSSQTTPHERDEEEE